MDYRLKHLKNIMNDCMYKGYKILEADEELKKQTDEKITCFVPYANDTKMKTFKDKKEAKSFINLLEIEESNAVFCPSCGKGAKILNETLYPLK